jgi:hypothetical protein
MLLHIDAASYRCRFLSMPLSTAPAHNRRNCNRHDRNRHNRCNRNSRDRPDRDCHNRNRYNLYFKHRRNRFKHFSYNNCRR